MSVNRRQKFLPLFTAAVTALFIAVLGGTLTDTGPWYQQLLKPSWQPPDWMFAPAWTSIYALIVVAAVKAWDAAPDKQTREWIIVLFCLNGAFNVFWSIIFFQLQRPDWALVEVLFFWSSILAIMLYVVRFSRTACYLLIPYLGWVTFASLLNLAVVRLNQPF